MFRGGIHLQNLVPIGAFLRGKVSLENQVRPSSFGCHPCYSQAEHIYQPSPGLHPGLPVTDPLIIEWSWAGRSQRVELWAWRADGGPYPCLPKDPTDALERRQVIQIVANERDLVEPKPVPRTQLVNRQPLVRRIAKHIVDLQLGCARVNDSAIFP